MALRPSLGIQQRQRLGLTQEIKSSLQYLALAGLRLEQTLQDVVESNPFLTVSATHAAHDDSDWIANLMDPGPDGLASALRALAADLFWRAEDRALANFLIDEVAESGLLATPLAEIDRPAEMSLDEMRIIQEAFLREGGLLADDLGQCFLAQATSKAAQGEIEDDDFQTLSHICQNLEVLRAGEMKVAPPILDLMRDFNPRPADQLDMAEALILPPDLIVEREGEGWSIRLNALTHRAYHLDEEMLEGLSPAARKRPDIAEPLKVARATVRALEARGQTLLNLTGFLCDQQDQALKSDRSALRPLTQGEAAAALDLHPSTISRAVAGKTVQTPQGVWALRDFFTALIDPQTQFSGAQLRTWMARAIADESQAKPLSDASLSNSLADAGHKVARRTVTKYRLRMGLPGAAERRQAYARRFLSPSPTERKSYETHNRRPSSSDISRPE